jgi:hypothetical protein
MLRPFYLFLLHQAIHLKKKIKKITQCHCFLRERDGMSSDFVQISVIIIAEKSMFKIFLP